MKITQMIKRENFFEINERTLKKYYKESTKGRRLYIYPALNAIVTACPSSAVRKYLYTEYRVSGSFLKRILVRIYVFVLLHSFGIFAAKSIKIPNCANRNTLIYPCNKKYRIFDFDQSVVSVVPKAGFPQNDLVKEIEFRRNNPANFVPALITFGEDEYTEAIIDGFPVARSGDQMTTLSDEAYRIWSDYAAKTCESVEVEQYAKALKDEARVLVNNLVHRGKAVDKDRIFFLCDMLYREAQGYGGSILVGLSHGDLQPGNIWLENGTNRIYIIDWEAYGRRSVNYDMATLYEGIRRVDGLQRFVKMKNLAHCIVLMEDLLFHLGELRNLPEAFGVKDFERFLKVLESRYV